MSSVSLNPAADPAAAPCCTGRAPLAPFKAEHLYYHEDTGRILCGAEMPISATYAPAAWVDLGACAARGYYDRDSGVRMFCETGHNRRLRGLKP